MLFLRIKQPQSAQALVSRQILTFPVADYNESSLLHPPSWYSCTAHSLALMHQTNDVYWLWSFCQSSGLMHLLTCSSSTSFSLVINLFHSSYHHLLPYPNVNSGCRDFAKFFSLQHKWCFKTKWVLDGGYQWQHCPFG